MNRKTSYPRVLVSVDGDALFFEGPALPVLFVSAADIARWTSAPTRALMTPITGALRISTLAVLCEARARFSVLRGQRPPSVLQRKQCLEFKTANGLKVACVDDDRVVIIDYAWFARRGYHLLVGPTLYHASKSHAPVQKDADPAPHFVPAPIAVQPRCARALRQLFTTI